MYSDAPMLRDGTVSDYIATVFIFAYVVVYFAWKAGFGPDFSCLLKIAACYGVPIGSFSATPAPDVAENIITTAAALPPPVSPPSSAPRPAARVPIYLPLTDKVDRPRWGQDYESYRRKVVDASLKKALEAKNAALAAAAAAPPPQPPPPPPQPTAEQLLARAEEEMWEMKYRAAEEASKRVAAERKAKAEAAKPRPVVYDPMDPEPLRQLSALLSEHDPVWFFPRTESSSPCRCGDCLEARHTAAMENQLAFTATLRGPEVALVAPPQTFFPAPSFVPAAPVVVDTTTQPPASIANAAPLPPPRFEPVSFQPPPPPPSPPQPKPEPVSVKPPPAAAPAPEPAPTPLPRPGETITFAAAPALVPCAPKKGKNPLFDAGELRALSLIETSLDDLHAWHERLSAKIKAESKGNPTFVWKNLLSSSSGRETIAEKRNHLTWLCDWAAKQDGTVDPEKVPGWRAEGWGVKGQKWQEFMTFVEDGCTSVPPSQGAIMKKFLDVCGRVDLMFESA